MTDVAGAFEPQFGRREPGVSYRDRPAAFAVVEKDGLIGCVFISRPEQSYFDLPGGALDPGETDEQALVREWGEEAGLVIEPIQRLGRAGQFMRVVSGEAVNNLCALFEARIVREDATLKIEDDHDLQWIEPLEAIASLRHEAHAWAVARG